MKATQIIVYYLERGSIMLFFEYTVEEHSYSLFLSLLWKVSFNFFDFVQIR